MSGKAARCRRRRARTAASRRRWPRAAPGCRPISIRRQSLAGRVPRVAFLDRMRQHHRTEDRGGAGARGAAPRPRARRKAPHRAGRAPCQTSSISATSTPMAAASAVLARRAETPTRSAPVRSLRRAKRPLDVEPVEQPRTSAGASLGAVANSAVAIVARPRRGQVAAGGGRARAAPRSRRCRRHSRATGVEHRIDDGRDELGEDAAVGQAQRQAVGQDGQAHSRGRDRAWRGNSRRCSFSLALRDAGIDEAVEQARRSAPPSSPSSSKPTSDSARRVRPSRRSDAPAHPRGHG